MASAPPAETSRSRLLTLLRSASPAASSAPLAPDIEAAHAAACAAGRDTYIDRVSGYSVFTRASHLARGACCGSACRHCPFGGFAPPRGGGGGPPAQRPPLLASALLRRQARGRPPVAGLLFSGGGAAACARLAALAGAGAGAADGLLLVAPFCVATQRLLPCEGDAAAGVAPALSGVFDVAAALRLDVLALALPASGAPAPLRAIADAAAAALGRQVHVGVGAAAAPAGSAAAPLHVEVLANEEGVG